MVPGGKRRDVSIQPFRRIRPAWTRSRVPSEDTRGGSVRRVSTSGSAAGGTGISKSIVLESIR